MRWTPFSRPGGAAPRPADTKRSVELDFLRGIAILLVMCVHFAFPTTGIALIDVPSATLGLVGGVGVNLFFTLSGFLVGGLLINEYKRTQKIDAWRFLGRRAFKIWPPFYVLILVHALLAHHDLSSFLWQNLLQVQNYFGSSIRQTWSLAVEEHFYLFLTALLVLIKARTPLQVLIILATICALTIVMRIVAVSHGYLDPAFRQTHFRIDSLLYGVMLAAVRIFYPDVFGRLAQRKGFLIGCALALCVFIYYTVGDPVIDRDVGYAVQGIGFSLLIVLIYTGSGRLTQQLWYRAVARIGVYSYGIYLWHSIVLEPGRHVVAYLEARAVAPVLTWTAVVIVQFGIATLVGVIMTRLVEWPALALRERVLRAKSTATGPDLAAPAQRATVASPSGPV